ncbi:MAG: hypothetical protein OCC45_15060 [Desulfotalea sp.]
MKKVKLLLILLALTLSSSTSFAGSATNCVSVGSEERSQTLINNCNTKIEVAWCHHLDKKGYSSGVCGNDGKFYQKHTTLKPGEIKKNKYSLPHGTKINYAACAGGYYTLKQDGMDGSYHCK